VAIQRTPVTRQGFERLKSELERLKKEERPRVTKAIAEARSHGDLAENAEYHAAREKQSFIEGRINELEARLSHAEIIDPPTNGDRVTFGSTVRLQDEDGKEVRYWIVGSDEAEPAKGKISIMSPLARTLIGREVGDTVVAQVPGGKKTYEILAANFRWADDN
jgi:transcription elongation factor GreA